MQEGGGVEMSDEIIRNIGNVKLTRSNQKKKVAIGDPHASSGFSIFISSRINNCFGYYSIERIPNSMDSFYIKSTGFPKYYRHSIIDYYTVG